MVTPKLLIILLLSFILSLNVYSQSGWVQQNSGVTNNLSRIYFKDAFTGFTGNPSRKTTNGGLNWSTDITPAGKQMIFVNDNTGYYAAQTVYKTSDQGISWINTNAGDFKNYVQFVDFNTGFTAGGIESFGSMPVLRCMKTTNGGLNWTDNITKYPFESITHIFSSLFFPSAQAGYIAEFIETMNEDIYSYIYKTVNLGNNWLIDFSSDSLLFKSIQMLNDNTGYCIGENRHYASWPHSNVITKRTNTGWQFIYSTYNGLNGLYFNNDNIGFVVCDSGKIIKTTNGGASWYQLNSGSSVHLAAVHFINDLTGYVVGNNGVILKTTTGGEAPDVHSVSGYVRYQDNNQPVTSGYVKAIKYDSTTFNIVSLDSAQIQPNGSYTLTSVPPVTIDIMAYENDEEELSFVPTYYVSTINWQNATHIRADSNLTNINVLVKRIINNGGTMHIGGYVYNNSQYDYTSLKDAVIYARMAGTYKGYSISLGNGTYRIDSLTPGVYEIIADRWGYGGSSYVINLTGSSLDSINFYLDNLLVKLKQTENTIPKEFSLGQNYPNPFNPMTTIKFGVPSRGNVSLNVYDITGRLVSQLLNNAPLNPGVVEVKFDGNNLSSGVYFYTLTVDNKQIDTKKMVLVK